MLAVLILAVCVSLYHQVSLLRAAHWKIAFLSKRVGELERRIYGCAMPDLTEVEKP